MERNFALFQISHTNHSHHAQTMSNRKKKNHEARDQVHKEQIKVKKRRSVKDRKKILDICVRACNLPKAKQSFI